MATLALDYDGTFTADPDLWLLFIKAAQERGHQVIVVTMRYKTEQYGNPTNGFEPMDTRLLDSVDRVIFTDRRAKKLFVTQLCVNIDIWIDDEPKWLFSNAF
jgi:hypothetical protein